MLRLPTLAVLAALLVLAASERSEARRYGADVKAYMQRNGVSANVADVFRTSSGDSAEGLYADDPVLQAIEDAVNS